MKLSVVIPVLNEKNTIHTILARVKESPVDLQEIIIVDDGSTDGTTEILKTGLNDPLFRTFFHEVNQGKGAAIRTGVSHATGDVVIIQDADLEYDPAEYPKLMEPILDGRADVVFGSRFMGGGPHRVVFFWHMVGNRFLTLLSNMMTNLNLTDMETCYKMFRREIIQAIDIKENRFWPGAGDYGQGGQDALPDLRGRDQLFRPQLRGRQKDQLEGRSKGRLLHPQVQPLGQVSRRIGRPLTSS